MLVNHITPNKIINFSSQTYHPKPISPGNYAFISGYVKDFPEKLHDPLHGEMSAIIAALRHRQFPSSQDIDVLEEASDTLAHSMRFKAIEQGLFTSQSGSDSYVNLLCSKDPSITLDDARGMYDIYRKRFEIAERDEDPVNISFERAAFRVAEELDELLVASGEPNDQFRFLSKFEDDGVLVWDGKRRTNVPVLGGAQDPGNKDTISQEVNEAITFAINTVRTRFNTTNLNPLLEVNLFKHRNRMHMAEKYPAVYSRPILKPCETVYTAYKICEMSLM